MHIGNFYAQAGASASHPTVAISGPAADPGDSAGPLAVRGNSLVLWLVVELVLIVCMVLVLWLDPGLVRVV